MWWIAVKYLFSPRSQYSYKIEASLHGCAPPACLQLLIPLRQLSPESLIFLVNFMSDWVNFRKQVRWIFVRNAVNFAVNFCRKRGEMPWIFFSPHSPYFSYSFATKVDAVNSSKNVANFAVNFCKKCVEVFIVTVFTAITAFLTKFHSIHRICYRNLPKKPRLGMCSFWQLIRFIRPVDNSSLNFQILDYLYCSFHDLCPKVIERQKREFLTLLRFRWLKVATIIILRSFFKIQLQPKCLHTVAKNLRANNSLEICQLINSAQSARHLILANNAQRVR